jgi:hypothetical protein
MFDVLVESFNNDGVKSPLLEDRSFKVISSLCETNVLIEPPDLRQFVNAFQSIDEDSLFHEGSGSQNIWSFD